MHARCSVDFFEGGYVRNHIGIILQGLLRVILGV